MVSVLVTAFIIFISFKGLADELNEIFIKLNNSIIEKNEKIKELEKKLLTNNIKMSKLDDENIKNLTNFVVNLNIEDNGNRCKLKKRV
jgi:predicted PurR-regulated permease PerM